LRMMSGVTRNTLCGRKLVELVFGVGSKRPLGKFWAVRIVYMCGQLCRYLYRLSINPIMPGTQPAYARF